MAAWISWYQKDQTILDFTEARDDGVAVASAGCKTICTLLQTDNHISTSSPKFFTSHMPFLTPKALKAHALKAREIYQG